MVNLHVGRRLQKGREPLTTSIRVNADDKPRGRIVHKYERAGIYLSMTIWQIMILSYRQTFVNNTCNECSPMPMYENSIDKMKEKVSDPWSRYVE